MKTKPTYGELEKELKELKAGDKSQILLDLAGVIFVTLDTNGIVTLVNKKACEIFGYEEKEMLGKNWFENFVPERIKNEILPVSKKILSGEIETAEYYENPILTKKGDEILIYWHNTPIKDKNGNITGHLSSGEDITERKKAEQALMESEEKFRIFYDDSPIAIWEEDFSKVKNRFDKLKTKGVTDLRSYFESNPDESVYLAGLVEIVSINKHSLKIFNVSSKNDIIKKLPGYFNEDSMKVFQEEMIALFNNQTSFDSEIPILDYESNILTLALNLKIVPGYEKNLKKVLVSFLNITKRKKIEQAFKESEEKYRIIADYNYDWEYWIDINGNFIYVSPSSKRKTGYKPEEFYKDKKLLEKIIYPDDKKLFLDHIHEIDEKGERKPIEFRIITRNKEIQWIGHVCQEVFGKDGELLGIRGSNRLITKRKNVEIALKESEERFREIFENAPDAIFLADPKSGVILDANSAASKLLLRSREEIIGMNQSELHPPQSKKYSKSTFREHNQESQKGMPTHLAEITVLRSDESEVEVEILAQTIQINNKPILQGIFREITARKQMEEKIQLQSEIMKNISEGIYLIGLNDGIIKYTNLKFEKMFGYNPGEMIGHDVSLVNAPTKKTPKETKDQIVDILVNEGEWHGEVENIKKDGTHFWCYANVSLFDHLKYGRVIISVHTDITERKNVEKVLKENTKRLKELNATKDKFFSIIGHDLKSPLGNVIGFSKLLHKNSKKYDQEKITHFANTINNSATITLELLENLLDWANIQTGKIQVFKEKFCVLEVINEVISKLEKAAALKEIKIKHKLSKEIEILADQNMFKTIMRNLLTNAIKFTKREGSISIKAKQRSNYTEISVKDTGIGISVKKQAKLFRIEENISTVGTEKETGTGLGLILCKEFIEKHGGEIWVESEVVKGSEFKFTIPLD